MKVIKRDGRAVDYNREKIAIAIEKANKEVKTEEKAKKKDINNIIKFIENLDKKRILVEDIQDIIEEKLMELKKYKLAKKYIVYRYTRALVRKQNTTDKSIFGIIKNSNELESNAANVLSQRNYIASEVSKDITKRFLLPEKINNAINEGILYFNDSSYFVNPIFKSSYINIDEMLENTLSSKNSFLEACLHIVTILQNVCQNQYGEVSLNLSTLSKYVKISKNKKANYYHKKFLEIDKNIIKKIIEKDIDEEINLGVNILLNPSKLLSSFGDDFKIKYILDLKNDDPFIKITANIFEKLLITRKKMNCDYPKIIYILNEENSFENGSYDYITDLVLKNNNITFVSQKILNENYRNSYYILGDNYIIKSNKKCGKFNLGTVSLNLLQIALLSNKNENELFKLLDQRLEMCLDALMIRYYALKGNKASISKIHYIDGAISRLEKDDLIDNVIKKSAILTLSCYGLDYIDKDLIYKILDYVKKTIDKWQEEKGLNFVLERNTDKLIANKFLEIDKERFKIEKNIKNEELFNKLENEKTLTKYFNGGLTTIIKNNEIDNSKQLIIYLYKNILCTEIKKEL